MIRNAPPQVGDRRPTDHRRRPVGAVIGIVTNNTDPEGTGRVKVRFPWLHDTVESHWARIAQPYAGPGRGSFWLPEVGDEVCVVFDRNDPNHPYILGGLWNGWDTVPEPGNPDGKDDTKIWETRNGHKIKFEDHPGNERITLTDGAGERHLVIEVADDTITLTAVPGDITWNAPREHIKLECVNLEVEVARNSTWKVDTSLTEKCTDRVETIDGPDTLTVGQTWSTVSQNASVNATQASVTAQKGSTTVTGGMSSTGGSRALTAETVRRKSAPERSSGRKMKISAKGAVTALSNGPMNVKHGAFEGTGKDVTVASAGPTQVLGGTVGIGSSGGSKTVARSVSIGPGGPSSPAQVMPRKQDFVEFVLRDSDGRPMGGADYVCLLADGSKRQGTLDASGRLKIPMTLAGTARVEFPDLAGAIFDKREQALSDG